MPQYIIKKKTPKELNDAFWNSDAGRLARIDKPIQAVYPEFTILSGIKGADFNTINKASRTLIKEPFRKKKSFNLRKGLDDPSTAKKRLGLELLKIFSPFRNGGKVKLSDTDYYSIMERVAKDNWKQQDESEDAALTRILNANDYDYRGYYTKYPNSRANANTHWTDEFKTVFHPTFSNESKYSGKISKFNPKGVTGGIWSGDNFIPNITQINYINNLRNMARMNSRLACGGRKQMACGGRPKAFWGAAVGSVLSTIGSAINARQQSDAYDEYIEQQTIQNTIQNNQQQSNLINRALQNNRNMQNAYQNEFENNIRYRYGGRRKASFGWGNLFSSLGSLASISDGFIGNQSTSLNNVYADTNSPTGFSKTIGYSVNPSLGYGNSVKTFTEPVNNIKFACGGRKKARNGKRTKLTTPYITDGGVAIPMDNGLYLLRGATHEDINERGQTGIGIQVGRHQIEAENGEVAQKKGRELRIFSDQPMLNGISPADAVEAGYNPDEIFAAQEIYKRMLGIKDDGSSYRCGGRNKKANGGLTRDKNYDFSKKPYPSVKSSDFAGKGRSYPIPTKADARDALRLAGLHGRSDIRAKVLARYPSLRKKAAAGLIDYYDDVQEPDATRTWASSYNGRGRRTYEYDELAQSPTVLLSIGDIAIDKIGSRIDNALFPNRENEYNKVVDRILNDNTMSDDEKELSLKILNAGGIIESRVRAPRRGKRFNTSSSNTRAYRNIKEAENARNKTANTRDFVIQKGQGSFSGTHRPTRPTPPTSIPYEYRPVPYNNSVGNRLRSTGYTLSVKSKKYSENLTEALANLANKSKARIRLRRIKNSSKNSGNIANTNNTNTNNTNTNNGTKETAWQKTKRWGKKTGKRSAIASGILIGTTGIGTAINYALTSEKINTTRNNNQPKQQAKAQSSNQTPTSTRNINDIIRDVRNVTTKDYLTPEQKALINGPIRVNSKHNRSKKEFGGVNQLPPVERLGRRRYANGGNPYWTKNNWGLDVKGADWIGLGTDILGSIGVGLINNAAFKDIKYDYTLPQYVDETPVAFDTTWHNGAQRANVERNRINARNIIGRNTASANVAVERMQESDTNSMMEQNKLWDEKANKETELRNLAAQNEQQVRARNAAARNAYYQQIADIKNREIDANNAIRTQRGQNFATSLAGIGQAASNFLSQAGQRYEDNQALRALAASRGAIMPSMIAAGVDIDDATLAGMIYNYNQRLQDPLVKPNITDYTNDADYSRALSKYEDENKLREQYQNAIDLAVSRLGMTKKGRRYLNRLGLL